MAVLRALAGDTVKATVKDAYDALKAVIHQKLRRNDPNQQCFRCDRAGPNVQVAGWRARGKGRGGEGHEDRKVVQALHELFKQMKAHGIGGEAVAAIQLNISGGTQTGIIGAGNVSAGTMSFGNR